MFGKNAQPNQSPADLIDNASPTLFNSPLFSTTGVEI